MSLLQRLGFTFIRAKLKVLSAINIQWGARYALKLFCTPLPHNRNKDSALFAIAAPLQLNSSGYSITGFRFNHPQPKKALILHGFSSTAKNFEMYVQPLINEGFEVLAFDAPAHGASNGKQVNAIIYKQMIKDVLQQFGPIHAFICHSFGGLALSLCMEEMQPLPRTKLVLIAPAAETTTAISNAFKMLGIVNEKLKNAFLQLIFDIAKKDARWFSVNRALPNIKADILIVQDEDDAVTPLADLEPLRRMALPHIQFHITQKLGHNKIYRDKKVVAQVINFVVQA